MIRLVSGLNDKFGVSYMDSFVYSQPTRPPILLITAREITHERLGSTMTEDMRIQMLLRFEFARADLARIWSLPCLKRNCEYLV